jgi:hypothetical protein
MGHDELIAFFRHEVSERRPPAVESERKPAAPAKHTPADATATRGADTVPEKTTSELLREWLGDPVRKQRLVATLSADRAGDLIGRSGSSVREAGDAWVRLKQEFKTYRAFRRYEKNRRRG